jgi:hypothetical protein
MFGPVDDDEFFGYEDDDDEGWVPRPEWLHPDCRSVCLALELGTCCKYPDNPLVRVAVELADGVDRALRLAADEDGELPDAGLPDAGLPDTESPDTESPETGLLYAELTRQFRLIPGLLAQIHAILPRLNKTALAQLLCPTGMLAGALDQARVHGGRESATELTPVIELVAECAAAIRLALDRKVVVARLQRRPGS